MTLTKAKSNLKNWYDKTASRYDVKGDNSFSIELQTFRKLVGIKEGDKILDIATGTGIYLLEAAKQGAFCYGFDISQKMLDELNKKAKELNLTKQLKEIKVGDAEKLNYSDKFFDWVFCIGLFDYYPLDFSIKVLTDIKRVLKTNGKALVDFPNINSKEVYEFKIKEEAVGNNVYIYKLEELKRSIENAGFKILAIKEAGMEIQFLLQKP